MNGTVYLKLTKKKHYLEDIQSNLYIIIKGIHSPHDEHQSSVPRPVTLGLKIPQVRRPGLEN